MKKKFAIITDIGGDFTRDIIKQYGLEETTASTIVWPDGTEKPADLYWETIYPDEFFSLMSVKKNNFYSSVSSPQTITDRLSALAEQGRNIIVITISSTMSGGFSVFTVVAKEIMEKYPNVKVEVIDSLRYGPAISLIAIEASLCRDKNMSFEETVVYLKDFRKRIHQCGTLDDLYFLARKGRISKGVAFMGSMVGIKPIADLCNETGQSSVIGKARGYTQLFKIFPKYVQRTVGDYRNKVFVVAHSGREKQALEMKKIIEETFKPKHLIFISIGQSTGCNVGPGLAAVFYAGDEQVSEYCVKEKAILEDLLRK